MSLSGSSSCINHSGVSVSAVAAAADAAERATVLPRVGVSAAAAASSCVRFRDVPMAAAAAVVAVAVTVAGIRDVPMAAGAATAAVVAVVVAVMAVRRFDGVAGVEDSALFTISTRHDVSAFCKFDDEKNLFRWVGQEKPRQRPKHPLLKMSSQ